MTLLVIHKVYLLYLCVQLSQNSGHPVFKHWKIPVSFTERTVKDGEQRFRSTHS